MAFRFLDVLQKPPGSCSCFFSEEVLNLIYFKTKMFSSDEKFQEKYLLVYRVFSFEFLKIIGQVTQSDCAT